ncbi:MAG: hypothetical protein ABMA01_17045, partial [Chthoniobacteraceae bacterium]
EYCRAGKLKEVSEWIAAGHPIDPPQTAKRTRRRSPLEIAIEKGFYALAELLLEGGSDPAANGDILAFAVRHREVEIAKLLLDRGASARSVWADDVFDGGAEMLKLFIGHGFDPTADLAYCNALLSHVHPLLFVLKEHKETFPDLQRQAEIALCHHCKKGNLRSVSLLLWAGARADAEVPDPAYDNDPETLTTPLEEAAGAGHLDVLKRLKPQDFPDVLKRLTEAAWLNPSQQLIDYLINLGAPLNTKAGGGSKVLDHLIWRLGWNARPTFGTPNPGEMDETMKLIEHLVNRGAKWISDPEESLRNQRARLRDLDPGQLVRLFKILKEGGGASVEFLESILASPRMRTRLGDRVKGLEAVLHPPRPKPAPVAKTDREIEKTEPKPRPPLAELCSRAEEMLLDIVRQSPALHFTRSCVTGTIYAQTARRRLGLPKGDNEDLAPIFNRAAQSLNRRLKSFSVEAEKKEWRRSWEQFTARLTGDAEWPDAAREASQGAESPNAHGLSDAGTRLLELVRTSPPDVGFTDGRTIASKIGLHARDRDLESYLREIATKAGISLRWEVKGGKFDVSRAYRIWIEADQDRRTQKSRGLNPRIKANFDRYTGGDLDAACALIHELVVKAAPTGADPLCVLRITSHRELEECFPGSGEINGGALAEFFHAVAFNQSVKRGYDFRDDADCWFLELVPETDWATSIAAIQHELSQPPLEKRLGVSPDAAKIIAWIETLQPGELLCRYTPVVEDACERRIGISQPWARENFPAYLEMLVDEINENTHYNLRVQAWTHYSQVKSRIRVAHKKTDMEDVLRRLHWIAWKRGVSLDLTATGQALERLLSEKRRSSSES